MNISNSVLPQKNIPWAYNRAEQDVMAEIMDFNKKFDFAVIIPTDVDEQNEVVNVAILKRDYIFNTDPADVVKAIFEAKLKPSFRLNVVVFIPNA